MNHNDAKSEFILETLRTSSWIPLDFVELFESFYSNEIKCESFYVLKEAHVQHLALESYLDNLSIRFRENDDEFNESVCMSKFEFVELLQLTIDNTLQTKKNEFIDCVKQSKDPKSILYSYSILTPSAIKKRYHELAKYFHPDKNSNVNSDIFALIKSCRDDLLGSYNDSDRPRQSTDELTFYETEGNYYLKIAIDFAFAYNKEWQRLELHTEESFEKLNQDHIHYYLCQYAESAYENFKIACRYADEQRNFEKMFALRDNLVKCKVLRGRVNDAKTIAYSILMFYEKFKSNYTSEHRQRIMNLLEIKENGRIESILSTILLQSDTYDFVTLNRKDWIEQKLRTRYVESKTKLFLLTVGIRSHNERRKMTLEYDMHERINSNLVLFAIEKNYIDYLKELSNCELFEFPYFSLDPQKFISILLRYDFSPDNIAFLLISIATCIIDNSVIEFIRSKMPKLTRSDLILKSYEILSSIEDERLLIKSHDLDEIIQKRRLRAKQLPKLIRSIKNIEREVKAILHGESRLALQDRHNSNSFKEKFNEARLISCINKFLIQLITKKSFENNVLRIKLDSIKSKIEKYSLNNSYDVILDMSWIIFGHVAQKNDANVNRKESLPLAIEDGVIADNDEKILLRAKIYEDQAEKSISLANKLSLWDKAEKYYSSISLPNNREVISGHLRSLFNLNKFDELLKVCDKNKVTCEQDIDSLILKAIVLRKKLNLERAESTIKKALLLHPTNKSVLKEKRIIECLSGNHEREKRVKELLDYPIDLFEKRKRCNELEKFKILSIDGGGIRGILPAFWLSELEHRTHKPVSQLFNLVSGTSTGGLIAASLVMPNPNIKNTPLYRASDLLKIYQDEGPNLFTLRKNKLVQKWNEVVYSVTYTDEGRSSVIGKYCQDLLVKDALLDLVIPAVKENNITQTHVFTRNKKYERLKFFDIVMSTSSAPTFFSPHKIDGIHHDLDGTYLDGGLHANNPAQLAFNHCVNSKITKRDDIFMLSLGTGSYIDPTLNFDEAKSLLFWAKNLYPIVSVNQESTVHDNMVVNLGKMYSRWQINMSRTIGLDDYREESLNYLLDLGNQHLVEMYESDDNSLNKLIDFLN